MRSFRNGLIIGVAAGYVIGARAGRERYEQIARAATAAWESGPAKKMRAEVNEAMPAVVATAKERVLDLRHRNGDSDMVAAATTATAFPA